MKSLAKSARTRFVPAPIFHAVGIFPADARRAVRPNYARQPAPVQGARWLATR